MAGLHAPTSLDKPMSVQDIVHLASSQSLDPHYPISSYFRSAQSLLKQASVYEHEDNNQMAYFLLYRHANLILDDLTRHPHAKDPEFKQAWVEARKAVSRSLAKLEVLKPRINKRYELHVERREKKEARTTAAKSSNASGVMDEGMRRLSIDSREQSPARLDPAQHQDMAIAIADRQLQRGGGKQEQDEDLSSSLIRARRQLDRPRDPAVPTRTSSLATAHAPSYPSVPSAKQTQNGHSIIPNIPPLVPSKSTDQPHVHASTIPPQLPPKASVHAPAIPSKTPASTTTPAIPTPTHQFTTTPTPESGAPLRTIFLPATLRTHFLNLAATNTSRNLETLGLLAGTLSHNAFFVTHLLLPPQTATSDTCEMIDESVLWSYIDEHESSSDGAGSPLMVLGWIHTHPTQSCFMSSRDLHSHVWYQVDLAEAVAVVCSGRDKDDHGQGMWGVYRLTDPPGTDVVRKCRKTGLFHPHDEVGVGEGGLYTDCNGRPGHVVVVEGMDVAVVDLRGKKAG